MEPHESQPSAYVSCIKLHGHRIIAPFMDEAKREEMRRYRDLAITVDRCLEARRRLENKRVSLDSGVSDSNPISCSERSLSSHSGKPLEDDSSMSTVTSQDEEGENHVEFESFPPLNPSIATLEHLINFGSLCNDTSAPIDQDSQTVTPEYNEGVAEPDCETDVAHTTASTDLSPYLDSNLEDSPESNRLPDFCLSPLVPSDETLPSLQRPAILSPDTISPRSIRTEYVSLKQMLEPVSPSEAENEDLNVIPTLVRQNSYTLLEGPSSLIMAHVEKLKPVSHSATGSPSSSRRGLSSREFCSSADSIHQIFAAPRITASKTLPSNSVPSSPIRKPMSTRRFGSVDNVAKQPIRRSLFTSTPGRPSRPTPRHSAKQYSQPAANWTPSPRQSTKRTHQQATNRSTNSSTDSSTKIIPCQVKSARKLEKTATSESQMPTTVRNSLQETIGSQAQGSNVEHTLQATIANMPSHKVPMSEVMPSPQRLQHNDLLVQQLQMEFEKQMTDLLERQREDQEKMRREFEERFLVDLAQYDETTAADSVQASCVHRSEVTLSEAISDDAQQALYMDSSSHKENVSNAYASSDLSSFKAHRRPEETFRPLHQNGQTLQPIRAELGDTEPRVARRSQPVYSQREKDAAAVIVAAARGFLVRRLLRTQRVQQIVHTIRDVTLAAVDLHREAGIDVSAEDVELSRRLIHQLNASWLDFYDVFFAFTPAEQMSLISLDRTRLQMGPQPMPRPSRLSSATQRSMKRRQNSGNESPAFSRRSSGTLSTRSQSRHSDFQDKARPSSVDVSDKSRPSSVDASDKSASSRKPWR